MGDTIKYRIHYDFVILFYYASCSTKYKYNEIIQLLRFSRNSSKQSSRMLYIMQITLNSPKDKRGIIKELFIRLQIYFFWD